jgi:hypothetical protein
MPFNAPQKLIAGLAALAVTGLTTAANAAVIFGFAAQSNAYEAAPGVTVTVPIYLVETLTDGSPSVVGKDGGLFGVGFRADRKPGSPATGAAALVGVQGNAALFDLQRVTTVTAASASVEQEQSALFDVVKPLPDEQGRILIGTLTLTAPTEVGLTTEFALGDSGPADQTVTYAITVLDGQLQTGGAFSITATAVPEPGLAAFATLACLAPLTARRTARRTPARF